MQRTFTHIAAGLALLIGVLSVLAGSAVFLGIDPGYQVVGWLPIYNAAMGVISILIAMLIIRLHRRASIPAAIVVFLLHSAVTVILLFVYRDQAARQSMGAMLFRLVVWGAIIALLLLQYRRERASAVPG